MNRRVLVAAIATVCAGALPAAAQAGARPAGARAISARPTLTGELLSASPSFQAPPYPFFLPCGNGPASETGANFTFTGDATGPFPGTFSEWGSVSYVPVFNQLNPHDGQGPVTAYHAVFKITSQDTTVVGVENMVPTGVLAECFGGAGGAGVSIGPIQTTYRAMILTPRGRYLDRGSSTASLSQDLGLGRYWNGGLSDQFSSSRDSGPGH